MTTKSVSEQGFTLVELMVALAIGMVLAVAILLTQLQMTRQNARSSDIGQRDNEARVAMGQIVFDIGAYGFVQTNSQYGCAATLNYSNVGSTAVTYVSAPAYGYGDDPANSGAVSAGTPIPAASDLTLTYPTASSKVRSDVLVIRRAMDTSQFPDAVTPVVNAVHDGVNAPMTTGILPVASVTGLTAGHMGLLQVPFPAQNTAVCIRIPISAVGANTVSSTAGTFMPTKFYDTSGNGFGASLPDTGITTALTNAALEQGKLIDVGLPTQPSLETSQVYYVDQTDTTQPPNLMKAVAAVSSDKLLPGQQPQIIGVGVVSFQLQFNVGGLTYLSPAQVQAQKKYVNIQSVRIAIVTESYNKDPDPKYTAPAKITVGKGFTDYVPSGDDAKRHFQVEVTEIPMRNS